MKSFYEMIQILAKVHEGRKYFAHHDLSSEVELGERVDYYSWEGLIKIGHSQEDDGSYFPKSWGVEGSLIKFKEDENGETVFDEKGKPIIDKEFENPGVHGENIPEPYLSGSKEVTGFKEVINIILRDELEEAGAGRGANPEEYDWGEYDGEMREEPDILYGHHKKITHDGKEITLGKADDHSPKQLPWYDNPSKIDPKEMEEAKQLAKQVTISKHGNNDEYEWRLNKYIYARTGRSPYNGPNTGGTYPEWVHTHEQALEKIKEGCYHEWEKGEEFDQYNQYLYTGKSGHYEICKKCGQKREVIKWQNNYSGD